MHQIEQTLAKLGVSLPAAPKPVASYVPAVRSGNLIFVSGQLPMKDGQLLATGKVPSDTSLEQGKLAAQQCAINGLAILRDMMDGDWSRLVRVVRIGVFVQSDHEFSQQPQVANGASDFLMQVLGDAGRHARAAVGTNALPLNAAVEIEFLFEVA
jgi:enamine deaminase RidA (YjgF/YER057c/UK114 family)